MMGMQTVALDNVEHQRKMSRNSNYTVNVRARVCCFYFAAFSYWEKLKCGEKNP